LGSESGIHGAALLKDSATYQPFSPESVGRRTIQLVAGKHSGTAMVEDIMARAGIALTKRKTRIFLDAVHDEAQRRQRALSPRELVQFYHLCCV
jgi:homocitrate synthase NifV